jgi:prophage antirepressor-like protein
MKAISNLSPFSFEGLSVRIIQKDRDPWFVAKDVAEVMGYKNTADAISKHCKFHRVSRWNPKQRNDHNQRH